MLAIDARIALFVGQLSLAFLLSKTAIVSQDILAFILRQRPAIGARRELRKSVQAPRFRINSRPLHPSDLSVRSIEIVFDGLLDYRVGSRRRLFPESGRVAERWPLQWRNRSARAGPIPSQSSALARIEDELEIRPNGVISDEVELIPKSVEFSLSIFVQNEFD